MMLLIFRVETNKRDSKKSRESHNPNQGENSGVITTRRRVTWDNAVSTCKKEIISMKHI